MFLFLSILDEKRLDIGIFPILLTVREREGRLLNLGLNVCLYLYETFWLFLNAKYGYFSHHWSCLLCLLPPSSLAPWKRRESKKSSYNLAPKIRSFFQVKLGLYAKDESFSFKSERVMAIFVHQGDIKYQFHPILNSWNLAQFSR